MTLTKNLNSEFYFKQLYKEFRHLLYAVVDSDRKIHKKEVDALREFEFKQLTPFQPYSYSPGLNQAFYAQFEFDAIADNNKDAAIVFSYFPNDLQRNQSNINEYF